MLWFFNVVTILAIPLRAGIYISFLYYIVQSLEDQALITIVYMSRAMVIKNNATVAHDTMHVKEMRIGYARPAGT
jgi:hypothetical protein